MTVRTGLARFLSDEASRWRGKKLGVLCHPASVDARLRHILDLLLAHGADVKVLFGPEHGVLGEAQDMEAVDHAGSGLRAFARGPWRLPTYSLYGHTFESLSPSASMLRGIDTLVIDLQDIGSRYYTFIYTMALAMRAAAEASLEVIVLDRPNPIGGALVEGGTLDLGFRSFVGLWPMANRHGMTIGEIAGYLHGEFGIGAAADIVAMEGYTRAMPFGSTGLPFVNPSPNMPSVDTAIVYPGMCLIEGTELSEGRGTTRPFELFGAPFIDAHALAAALEKDELPGVVMRPAYFKPMFQKHAGALCGGVQLHLVDREAFRSYRTGVACIAAVARLWPREFRWRHRAYEFVEDIPAFDLLAGNARLRSQIDAGAPLAEMVDAWQADEAAFLTKRAKYLLY